MDDIKLSNIDIGIGDTAGPVEEKKGKARETKAKPAAKPTYASAKNHVIAKSVDALYLESVNKLVVPKGGKPITSAHDIGAACYYTLLYYAPEVPVDHPLTYLIMAGFGCGLDIAGAVTAAAVKEEVKFSHDAD